MRSKTRPFRVRILPQTRPWWSARSRCLNNFLCRIFGEGLVEVTLENLEQALAGGVPFKNIFNHRDGIWFISGEAICELRTAVDRIGRYMGHEDWSRLADRAAGELILDTLYQKGYPI